MPRLLLTAGPTYEPLDAVRFIGNRSSGKLGSLLADAADARDWDVRLLLGPNAIAPKRPGVQVVRFESTADLQAALEEHLGWCDCLVMAAAVADYRPCKSLTKPDGKHRRTGDSMHIELVSTPDLLAKCAGERRDDQLLVGFALEPRDEMLESAHRKLKKKDIDLIVANPLETMDGDTIEARLIGSKPRGFDIDASTPGAVCKSDFAPWLLDHLTPIIAGLSLAEQSSNTHAT